MADVKISALPIATTPLAGTEVLPIVQSATTDQVTVANLTAGRAVSAASLTLSTPLSAANGGTGLSSLGTGVATALGNNTNGASGLAVLNGSGVLAVAQGGTGLSSLGTGVATALGNNTNGASGLAVLNGSGFLAVAQGGTATGTAGIGAFNNITGYTASGATGTTSTNLVFSTSPTLDTPTFTTNITAPLVIGGTGTTSTLTLRSTSGVGATGSNIIFQTGNNGATTAMTILNSGNLGISTTTPQTKLQTYAADTSLQIVSSVRNDNAGTGIAAIGFDVCHVSESATGAIKAGIGLQRSSGFGGGPLCFYNNNSGAAGDFTTADEKMRIDISGNVAIGTTSTTSKLLVYGDTNGAVVNTTQNANAGSSAYSQYSIVSNAGQINFQMMSTAAGGASYIYASPTSSMSIYTSTNTPLQLGTNNSASRMTINANGTINFSNVYGVTVTTPRNMFIDSSGNVGGISSVRASKTNINPISDISWLFNLSPMSFNYRKKDEDGSYTDEFDSELMYGLIAEDVEIVNPHLCAYNDEDGEQVLVGINYDRLAAPLIAAIKELAAKVAKLEAKI